MDGSSLVRDCVLVVGTQCMYSQLTVMHTMASS